MPSPIASRQDFDRFFENFFSATSLPPERQSYFRNSADRLWLTAQRFGLFQKSFEHLLEIGPGFAYLPFAWKHATARQVSILDGESVELLEFETTYRRYDIQARFADLFKLFGERDPDRNRLPFDTAQFDAVICWETMEHFNFNPIPFLQDLLRITRPGGRLHLTVPNQAKLDLRLRLLAGRSVRTPIEDYFLQLDDRNFMKYAPHWREYTLDEYTSLLQRVGFRIQDAGHLHTFQNLDAVSFTRALKRRLGDFATRLLPSTSALCVVEAIRP